MNKLSRVFKPIALTLGIFVVTLVLSACPPELKWGGVIVVKVPPPGPDHMVLLGPPLNSNEREAFNKVLSKYNKSLYRVATFKNGSIVKGSVRGKLADIPGIVSFASVAKAAQDGARSDQAFMFDGAAGGDNSIQMIGEMKKILARFTR